MNNEIILISTTSILTATIKEVLKKRKLDFPIYEATMEEAYKIAEAAIQSGTKVVICRGGTAAYLRDKVGVPIVDIRHGFIDMHLSVESAKKISDKIGVVGFRDICEAANDYNQIMKTDICVTEVKNENEIKEKLKEHVNNGTKVVIGGFQLAKAAKKYNVPYVAGQADPSAINLALNEALHDLKIEIERKEKYETINSILNCTSEGIVGIEIDGQIMHINEIAKKILNYKEQRNIKEILPSSLLIDTANTGKENFSELINIGGQSIVINSVPIKVEDKTIGAVATIQEENKIQSIDREIRKKHLGSGHVAKKTFADIIGRSRVIDVVKKRAVRYAQSDSTILIIGETGTGKEVFAQSIHNYSNRKRQPFVAINCAALPENILESELFGYVKGAFTGARNEGKAGIFELAHMGTVFLDEISEVSTDVQVKLLRVIQEKEVSRIGDDKVIPIDVRILAASNKNLMEEIYKGNFREDLYYRLAVLELELPPLRDRKGDVKELIHYFIKEKTKTNMIIAQDAIQMLCDYDWPGNIRQLANIIERLTVICEGGIIDGEKTAEVLKNMTFNKQDSNKSKEKPASETEAKLINIIEMLIGEKTNTSGIQKTSKAIEKVEIFNEMKKDILSETSSFGPNLFAQIEAEIIKEALEKTGGNREKAAELLCISTTTLWRRMKKFNIL
ncbi:Transcriptional regulator containing PAS, AAA-type ATPase, and DNA-binding Fis domains [Anaerovirgula multivorans]|uniref:Transcriptional regulator containing PAS, AAA-type ATPase, and DNA-binding Fis domains n=1 Tax=Anaerovirgula multivorans TaxID=312168 RepID=A0A239GNM2_9FIRM|nr:sigma 54-interacting transcriptional regulator [Anaerovirgula multivorans]SNS70799.1 Transcriptional regulator containing PAS, AAA-type ATPase, and DNA-binding Fis domains [Anaerovirgula multivorans]